MTETKDAPRSVAYLSLSGFFVAIFGLFNVFVRRPVALAPFDIALLGLSVYRLGRMVAYDKVMTTYRSTFVLTVADQSGAGDTTEPRYRSGAHQAIGELLSCPICAGTWIAAGLVYGLAIVPRPTRTFLYIFSAIGIGELLNAATEALSWFGQAERDEAGKMEGNP